MVVVILSGACQPAVPDTIDKEPTATNTPRPTATRTPTPTPTSLAHLQIEPEDLNGIKLRFWHPWTGETSQVIAGIVDEFNQTNIWGIHVIATAPGSSGSLYDLVTANLTTGENANVVVAPIEQILSWQEHANNVINLNDYIEDQRWGLTAQEIAEFPLIYWEQDQANGRQLGIPAQRTAHVLFYNQSWAEELNFSSPPSTANEFQTQVCAAAKAVLKDEKQDNDGTGGWIVNIDPLTIISWMLTFGAQEIPDLNQKQYVFNAPPSREMLEFLRQLFDDGCAWMSRGPTPHEYFANRQTLIYSGTLQDLNLQSRTQKRLKSKDEWMIIPYPENDGKPVVVVSGPSYAILVASREEQLASWLFIRWLILPRHQALLVEASDLLPVSVAAVELLTNYRRTHPQWEETLLWVPIAQTAPGSSSWRVVSQILEDAAWQTFQPNVTPDQIPSFLSEVDKTIPEVLTQSP